MMNEKLMKNLAKKGKKLEPNEQKAKMDVLKELSSQAGSMMGDKLKGLKKVTVASDSKEGLAKGLKVAEGAIDHQRDPEKLVEEAEEEMGEDLDHDNEEGESAEHREKVLGEHKDYSDCSPEELEKMIQELMAAKEKLSHKM